MTRSALRFPLLLLVALLAFAGSARAQIKVTLSTKRPFYMRYEPLEATVKITNLSGRDLMLSDGAVPWFSFQIVRATGELLSPNNPDYHLDPLEIKLGETLKREVDLVQLYPVTEYGLHKIRAVVYSKELDKYFESNAVNVEVSDGRVIWSQSVGVPETLPNSGATHRLELLTAQSGDHRYLYCRVTDENSKAVYCTSRLGHVIDRTKPQVQLDATNTLHVLHYLGPKTYQLSMIGVNGEPLGRTLYDAPKYRPILKRDSAGTISVLGAKAQQKVAAGTTAPVPKLSDRPPGLPR
jgi:hypothetical protein